MNAEKNRKLNLDFTTKNIICVGRAVPAALEAELLVSLKEYCSSNVKAGQHPCV